MGVGSAARVALGEVLCHCAKQSSGKEAEIKKLPFSSPSFSSVSRSIGARRRHISSTHSRSGMQWSQEMGENGGR